MTTDAEAGAGEARAGAGAAGAERADGPKTDRERDDLLEALRAHRGFLRYTARELTDEQARQRTTVSELTIGGLIKHVTRVEEGWASFIVDGPAAMGNSGPDAYAAHIESFRFGEDESLAALLDRYAEVAARTDELVMTLPSLDLAHELPPAPWFEPGATRSIRRTLIHIIGETAQHAGHADIIREALDGAKTMG